MERQPFVFGIRHLSPAGAYYLKDFLNQVKPELVMIEGPSDFTDLITDLGEKEVKPPIAVMAYTKELPIRTILYPFAEYSPEYQALLWAKKHQCSCRFCDLPSEIFMGIKAEKEEKELSFDIYDALDKQSEDRDHETFWERTIEQCADMAGYKKGAQEFGKELRELSFECGEENKENLVREAYMRRKIAEAVKEGFEPEKIVVVTGAFHVEGILSGEPAMSDKELKLLPKAETMKTLMPYSYYRLSERSGYGAGNHAPAYYEYLWQGLCRKKADYGARKYLSSLSAFQRKHGGIVSAAEVIEAYRLASALAQLHGSNIPTLKDLRDAAVTCMGHGVFSELALAVADTEIGTKIGGLPQGVSQTSIQADFYEKLKDLRLEKYKSMTAESLDLDLRENLRVKTEKAAFIDLHRSFFLHRLRILGIQFASVQKVNQERATWAESWILQWTPEAEIQIVEAVLKGDTVEQAAAFELKKRIDESQGISELAQIVEESFYCGMPIMLISAIDALQEMAVDAASVIEIADTAASLSVVIQYGDIRRLDRSPLIPLLSQLFLRVCLILPQECVCDDQAANAMVPAVGKLHEISVRHDFLDSQRFVRVLTEIASRDDLNTRLSGMAAALLLEQGIMDSEELGREVSRRLSKGIPAELGSGWFAGLSSRNHYALIARLTLWEKLSEYLDTLDEEEFKRALLFLRRAFADFTSLEKSQIAENLGEIWQVNPQQVSEILNENLTETDMNILEGLEEFDFGDM